MREVLGGIFVTMSLLGACVDQVEDSDLNRRSAERDALVASTRNSIAERGVTPVPPAPRVRDSLVELGRALAFDKLLSGSRDTSCMTCHPAEFATGDGRHLSMGVTGTGAGPARTGDFAQGEEGRNAPPLFNLHVMPRLFWDGRVEQLADGTIRTPGDAHITPAMRAVFEFGAISALPMFPVTARDEMRGFGNANDLAQIDDANLTAIWEALMARLGAIPEYRKLFEKAYPGQRFQDMTFAHAANAIGGFIVARFEARNSPWDRFLEGNDNALDLEQLRGAEIFMRTCVNCHSGPVGSDNEFHNTALAQFGPGPRNGGDGPSGTDDFGRERVTLDVADRYAFRTTPLRNVEFTAPFGHTGEIVDLRDFIAHYAVRMENGARVGSPPGPAQNLREYDITQVEPRLRSTVLNNFDDIIDHIDPLFIEGSPIEPEFVDPITAFMIANTDQSSIDRLGNVTPKSVPSGLPVAD
jgi:cytochrome c peroxidase